LKQLEALRGHEQQQRISIDAVPKRIFEIDHTNASANSSGDGSGWTEVSVTPHVMEMKQASSLGGSCYFREALNAALCYKNICTLCFCNAQPRPTLRPRASDDSFGTSTLVRAATLCFFAS
jgi:hypothetical protein